MSDDHGLGAVVAFLCVVCGCFGLLMGRMIAPQPDPFEHARLHALRAENQACYAQVFAARSALHAAIVLDKALLARYAKRP